MNNTGVTQDVLKSLFTDECFFIPHLSMKQSLFVVKKSHELIQAKSLYQVKVGIDVTVNVLKHIGDEIIKMAIPISKGVDFAREERMEVRNQLLDEFRFIFKSPILKKYRSKENQLMGDFNRLYEELYNFLIMADRSGGNGGDMELA